VVWATFVTTGSEYQQDLIRRFANGVVVSQVPCSDLACVR
jgi:glutamate racemase